MEGPCVLNLSTLPTTQLSIRANVPGNPSVVRFSLSGASSHTQNEKVAPYALFGDTSGDYKAWTPAVGTYRLDGRC